ncbi:MAG: endonuclease domain-containing protein [Alphaproteobacteria bacterium]
MTVDRARTLREQSTDAERRLWSRLRDRQLNGFKFRRQVGLGRYIADFVCFEKKLISELDGGQHADVARAERDEERSAEFGKHGFRVLRFWNNDVLENAEGVLASNLLSLRD